MINKSLFIGLFGDVVYMQFNKKVFVLKQILDGFSLSNKRASAICRIEQENQISTLFLSVVNLMAQENGKYFLYILDDSKKIIEIDLDKRPISLVKTLNACPNLNNVVVGICYVENFLPETVMFTCSENCSISLIQFKKAIAEKCLENSKITKKVNKIQSESCLVEEANKLDDNVQFIANDSDKEQKFQYNDEAVATENYYDKEDEIRQKLKVLEGWDNDRLSNENVISNIREQEKEEKDQNCFNCIKDEGDFKPFQNYSPENPYYLTVKSHLDELFEKFNHVKELEKMFYNSNFIKIAYAEDKHYVVGLIKEDQKEKYICYGVPGEYSLNPPKELQGYCSFVPVSIFNLKGNGYWMMFQSAVTGECLSISDKI